VKNFIYLICISILGTSCASTRNSSAVRHPRKVNSSSDPAFLDNIIIRSSGPARPEIHKPVEMKGNSEVPGTAFSPRIENCSALQFKYAIIMEDEVEHITNERLISFLEEWYGIPYKYGGGTRMGIDCSAFSSVMMGSVYDLNVPRTCREQYQIGKKIKKSQLSQGDLVFFNTTGRVSHVGVFLGNNKFVHASTSNGVMISDMEEAYFKRRYIGAARIR